MIVTREITLTEMGCGECDIVFAMPDYLQEECRRTGRRWWCPNGHCSAYQETEVSRLNARLIAETDQRKATERTLAATQDRLDKTRRRAANGVCPCCKRTFANVARHMASKHPEEPTT